MSSPRNHMSLEQERKTMTRMQWTKAACAGVVFAAVAVAGNLSYVPSVTAQSGGDSKVQIGLGAAPVHLNMAGRNQRRLASAVTSSIFDGSSALFLPERDPGR